MAIEAARQLAGPNEHRITGYRLRNTRFLRAITVDESERGSEARIQMRPRKQATNLVEASSARRLRFMQDLRQQYDRDVGKCSLGVYHTQLYQKMAKLSGFDYGPYFQQVRNISYDRSGHASATLALGGHSETMPYAQEDPCFIYPTTLDAIYHLQIAALSKGGWETITTMMFSHLKDLWVSHKLLAAGADSQLRAATHETMPSFREAECKTIVLLADSMEPVLVVEGQRGTAITSFPGSAFTDGDDSASRMSYGIPYQPDLSLLTMEETEDYLIFTFDNPKYRPLPKETVDRGDAISLFFVENVLKQLDVDVPQHYEDHFERYVAWMRRVAANRHRWAPESRGLGHLAIQDFLEEAEHEPTQKLAKKFGENLYQILKGDANALPIIFEGGSADAFYYSEIFSVGYRKVGAHMSIMAHKNPQLRVLEIGAGTGSSTAQILRYLVLQEGMVRNLFAEYMYTEISPGFFEKAKERFNNIASHIRFQKLDLEFDPCSQGFAEASYDVIVAGNVLHATTDLIQTLQYVKKLLRPGGKLIMGETTNIDNVRDGLIFGLLPGWWLREEQWWSTNEEYQDQRPLLTEEQWARVLPEAGFSGLDLIFCDHDQQPHHRVSILVSSATDEPVENSLFPQDPTKILINPRSGTQTAPSLDCWSFMVLSLDNLLRGGDQNFINLSLECSTQRLHQFADATLRVLRNASSSLDRVHESEHSEKDGVIQIPRVAPMAYLNDIIVARSRQPDEQTYVVGGDGPKPCFNLTIETSGLLDTLYYAEQANYHEELKENEVEIEVKATSLNFKDVMIALGQIPGKGFGFDGSGFISRTPPGSNFSVGDWVMYCTSAGGGFGTFVQCS
ncbi:hypothetical protein HBI56_188070 [Parastagonospora nodorum]|nr:hypothetical protein HBH56_146410 [Parastagonospora nodorum]KAH3927799.1 hypothetical protein HBH54_151600 [Parastagonospora nodorum]KAH3947996.1 hypothetical protein HBH53_111620 [Parastagonospora nodorum]KAH3960190.1 hypothetical protein HBH51_195460 [Parastagonospora nodorum]KAH3970985.1 hypothetical protein HBH52_159890 [Parastagonospora nodorum]